MRTLRPLIAFAFVFAALNARAQQPNQTRLLRTPSVSATHIAFAYAQDIWVVDRKGGMARRLTTSPGEESNPEISPDGKSIAFSGSYSGNTDVYVMPIEGGEPKRLTWHNGADMVQGWTPDGKQIMFASNRESNGPNAAPRFFLIPVGGGIEQALPLNRAFQGKISPDGRFIAYRMNTSWDDERRNYRGGQNRPIWIVDLKSLDVTEAKPWTDSKDIDPAWIGDVVYFISDRDGVENVWSYDTKSKKMTQLTRFNDYDVKTLDTGGDAVVFEQAGYIHELDPKTGKEHIVDITAAGDFPWMMPQWKDVSSRLGTMSLSPTGRRAIVEARGEIFTIPAQSGDVRNLSNSSSSAENNPAWSADGKWISYFSDKSGEYKLVIESADNTAPNAAARRELVLPTPKHYYTASWSPDSKKILYHDTDLKLWVMDVASGQAKIVGEDPWMVPQRTMNPVWSPDSRWIAYVKHLNSLYKAVVVYNLETGQTKQITDGLADATWPAWDASGKYLWFLASTDYGLRSQWLDMSSTDHDENFGLYVTVLKKSDPSPFLPESDEEGGPPTTASGGRGAFPGGGRGGRGGGAGAAVEAPDDSAPPRRSPTSDLRPPTSLTIDFDGLQNRILAVPNVTERGYSRLKAGPNGMVFYFDPGTAGAGGRGGAGGAGASIQRYNLRDRRPTSFISGVADYDVSLDGRKLLYRAGGGAGGRGGRAGGAGGPPPAPQLFIVDADRNPPAAGTGAISANLRMFVDPKEEYKQIFAEAWRNQRDYLYVPNQHGSDWPAMRKMYGALLPYVNHRADLNYVIDMMGAEIAIGHSYVRGGEMPENPTGINAAGGQLGADVVVDNASGRYKLTKIFDNESWNPDLRAPLASPGVDVRTGDYILEIDGTELKAPDNIWRLLEGTADHQTTLTVNQRPVMEGARRVTVVPIASDQQLRTRAWVENNRRTVDSLSKGKLAYVYLPNTGGPGYTSFNRYYFAQQDKQGAVIDERFNGGGQAADYIIDALERKFDGYFNNVAGDRMPFTSPSAGIWGPKVMIVNEMAGSGGDLMPYMFKLRKIGPLVGKRTWGGLVHTADTPPFVDGGSAIAPRGGFFSLEGKWAVENEGAPPDIDVENWPKDVAAGHDMQLERAVQEGLRLLAANPVKRLMKEPPPPTWGARVKPIIP